MRRFRRRRGHRQKDQTMKNDGYVVIPGSLKIGIGGHVYQIDNPALFLAVCLAILVGLAVLAFVIVRKLAS